MTYQPFDIPGVNAELLPKHPMPWFKFADRGFEKNMLLIPGWATDWRIFDRLDIPFNYLMPENALTGDFNGIVDGLPDTIISSGLSVLGWSMGGFIAAELASRHPAIFNEVILVSMRRRYDRDDLKRVRDYIEKSPGAYLYKFYGGFFSADEKDNKWWFKDNLLKKYTEDTGRLRLLEGLDYLEDAGLDTGLLNGRNVTLVHGEDDRIAPPEGARSIAARIPRAKFISIKGACHLPFLREEFGDIFADRKECRIRQS